MSVENLTEAFPDREGNATNNQTRFFVGGAILPASPPYVLSSLMELLGNLTLLVIALSIGWKCVVLKMKRTAEHAFYCTVGQLLLVAEAMMVDQPHFHAGLGLFGIGFGLYGMCTQCLHQQKHPKRIGPSIRRKHFRSSHSIIGLCANLLLLLTLVTGLALLHQHEFMTSRRKLILAHRICGLCCFELLMATLYFSFNTGFMQRNWAPQRIPHFKVWTVIAAISMSAFELASEINTMFFLMPDGFFELSVFDQETKF